MINKNIIDYTVENAMEHIRKGIYEARKKEIEANTIILNEGFAMTNHLMFHYVLNDDVYNRELYPPMLFGLQVRYQSEPLPNNANFILTKGVESKGKKINDLEEELGIDILTLFRAVREGFYYKKGNDIIHTSRPVCLMEHKIWCNYEFDDEYSNYGETWALTREELEDKDE